MKATFSGISEFVDGHAASGTFDRPLAPPSAALSPSHPDEPRPLFGASEQRSSARDGYEPNDLVFPEDRTTSTTHEPQKAHPVPHNPTLPKPLFADEPVAPSRDRSPASAAVGTPGALRFPETPAAPAHAPASSAPSRVSPTALRVGGLSFVDAPAVAVPSAAGNTLFASTESPLIARGMQLAQTKFPDLWAQDGGATFQRHLRQLLPLDRAVIETWGNVVLDRVTDMATTTARLTRSYIDLNGNEMLARTLEEARAPAPKMWQRLVKPTVSLDECRLRLKNLHQTIPPLTAQANQHRTAALEAEQRLARYLASLSVITTLSGSIPNNGLARTLDDRSALLANSLRQASLLAPQLKNLAEQMHDLIKQLDEALAITFPALELARAGRA